jgi:YVTN family beta-propeller protein
MDVLDLRSEPVPKIGLGIVRHYNGLEPGSQFDVLSDIYPTGLSMWLIEAGILHEAAQDGDACWRISITRSGSPGQGTIPGLHHVVAKADGTIFTCERGERVARIDGKSGKVEAVNTVGKKTSHLAVQAEGEHLYISDFLDNALIAVRTDDMTVAHRWPAPGGPQLPIVTKDGIVAVTGPGGGTLTIVRPKEEGAEVQTIEVGSCPHDPEVSADGKIIYVPCAGDGVVAKVDLSNGQELARIPVGDGPTHMARHPDGDRFYVANSFSGDVTCFSEDGEVLARAASGPWAHAISITPNGQKLYVANFYDNTLAIFDPENLDRLAILPTEAYPHGLDISPDGRFVVVTGFSSEYLRIHDAASGVELHRTEVGGGSSHTAFLPDGKTAVVACSVADHLAFVDLETGACSKQVGL